MPTYEKISLKSFPFIRLVVALTIGIIIQWYWQVSLKKIIVLASLIIILILVFSFLSASKKFVFNWLRGIIILAVFTCLGMIITWQQNIHNNNYWYGENYKPGDFIIATIKEPIVEKTNSYKAISSINGIYKNNKLINTNGNVLLYFKKDSTKPQLQYGSEIVFAKSIQQIQNSGNPASFNYNRYCLFQNITGQVFLVSNDYKILNSSNRNIFQNLLFKTRDWALNVLKQNIHSPKELGIAEALLIGYRNDLDKDLVQAYSNTGVVHIIAISGLHIGVIYAALLSFFSLFKPSKIKRWLEPVLILLIIWMFTLIAGAAPSVLRASVMFTFLLAGKFLNRNGNMYNTLAASAFVLLLINPFYLWDVGFQLSYSAVFSIVLCYKKVSGLLYFKNKSLRWVWQLSAVSLSAQFFTLPLVIYHFHQLPLLFLFSNLVAVPLSGIILFEELILFCFSWWHSLASIIGWLTEISTKWMNEFIEHIDKLSFSVWDGLHISIVQLIIMLIAISFFCWWQFYKKSSPLLAMLVCVFLFFVLGDADLIHHKYQQEIIVYNIPKQSAMDVIAGNIVRFAGDSEVLQSTFLRNFNLKPSRVKNRVYNTKNILLPPVENFILRVNNSKILLLGKNKFNHTTNKKIPLNILVLTKNSYQTPAEINQLFQCDYVVADGSVPAWKSVKWKKEFEQLHLRFFSVAQEGAFTLKL